MTHDGDEYLEEEEEEEEFKEEAIHDYRELKGRADKGELVNFRDIMLGEKVRLLSRRSWRESLAEETTSGLPPA